MIKRLKLNRQQCSTCNGKGRVGSTYLGTFTQESMAEQFIEDYLAGHYDQPCETCGGTGKVTKEPTEGYTIQEKEVMRSPTQLTNIPKHTIKEATRKSKEILDHLTKEERDEVILSLIEWWANAPFREFEQKTKR